MHVTAPTRCTFIFSAPPNLFLNGDEVSEDIRKWTVNDVYSFISSIPTCSEYAQVGTHSSLSSCLVFIVSPLCWRVMWFHSADIQGPHDRRGDTASPVRGASTGHTGAETGTGSKDPLTGQEHRFWLSPEHTIVSIFRSYGVSFILNISSHCFSSGA